MSPMAQRYPASAMLRARELRKAEWSYRKIAELVHRETGHKPAATTVALWCYPESQKCSRRALQNHVNAVKRSVDRRTGQRLSPEWKLARMRELSERGLKDKEIGLVAAVWFGDEMSAEQVRSRLDGKRKYERKVAA